MILIKTVDNKKDVKEFATYPLKLYKPCPYYVPSMREDELNTFDENKNVNLKGCKAKGFLAYKDGELVGRIMALICSADSVSEKEQYVRFSRFECIDDIEVFKALLGAVEVFGKENGANYIHGPWGFNDQDREGMLTYGFDKRSTYATNYYYPYFCENMVKLGFEDESKWIEKSFTIPKEPYERITALSEKIKKRFNLVEIADTLSLKQIIKRYGLKLFDCVNEAYGDLDGYVQHSDEVKASIIDSFGVIVNTRYISILVDSEDKVAAFGICLPSICDALIKSKGTIFPTGIFGLLKSINKPKELEMALIGVSKKYKNAGLNSVVICRIMNNVIADGIERIESNPMLETNLNIQQQWKFAESEVIKKRQTYKKKIGEFIDSYKPM